MEDNTTRLDPMDELDILSGPYLEPYWDDFVKFETEVRHIWSWSWGAFFFGVFWFAPRRLYSLVFISLLLVPTIIMIAAFFHQPLILIGLYGSWMIFRGRMGKYLFYRSLKDQVEKAAAMHDPEGAPEEYAAALRKMAITDVSSQRVFAMIIAAAIIVVMALIAIPNFMHYCAKSKQSEAKTNLKGIFTYQISFFGKNERYGSSFDEIGFELAGGTAKTYGFGLGEQRIGVASPDILNKLDELTANTAGDNEFVAYAVGNIDADPTLDIWAINQENELENIFNDVTE